MNNATDNTAETNGTTPAETPRIETETCGRCGGSGHYSYCQRYGTICFGCGGSGRRYTKRGKMARDYFDRLLSKPAHDLKPGDKIRILDVTNGGDVFNRWATVTELPKWEDESDNGGYAINPDGSKRFYYRIRTDKQSIGIFDPADLYRVAATKERKAEALREAVAYQNSLTKAGTPRKR